MRKIRDVLRLSQLGGLSRRAIARSLKVSPTTVGECLRWAAAAGLEWGQVQALDDAALERRLYPNDARHAVARPQPEWAAVHRELRRKGVTLALLWEEYKALHPDGLQYSWFCDRYRAWAAFNGGPCSPTLTVPRTDLGHGDRRGSWKQGVTRAWSADMAQITTYMD